METNLRVERNDAHAVLTLDRPTKKNALSTALRDEISDALDDLAGDESVKAVVITGAGDTFSAGFDLSEFPRALEDEAYARTLWASSDRYHHAVLRFPVPTIAAVNGAALAGGFDLAVCCDLRVAATTARFAHPEYTFGDVVYSPLADLVGGAIAPRAVPDGTSDRRDRSTRAPPGERGHRARRPHGHRARDGRSHRTRAARQPRADESQGRRPPRLRCRARDARSLTAEALPRAQARLLDRG